MEDSVGRNAGNSSPPRVPQNLLSILLESVSDTVMVTDREGHIRYWNRGAEQSFQYTATEILGKHVSILYSPAEGEELMRVRELTLAGEVISNLEMRERRKDGKEINMLLSIVPILGDTGEVDFLAGIGKDITNIRELEEKALAAEKLDTVREMIVTFNHRVNQPLAVIGCYLGMLLDRHHTLSPDKREQYLREIEKETERIAHLLRRLAELEEVYSIEYLAEKKMIDLDLTKDPTKSE